MSSVPRDTCTECRQTHRSVDVMTFSMCNKHRICKGCMAKTPRPSSRAVCEECPLCELSRRRVGVSVRAGAAADARRKVACVRCNEQAHGQSMKCGHGYCTPCLRLLPKTALSRNVDGSMKLGCIPCEAKAAAQFREEARHAMEHAESCAAMERDARELREIHEDVGLVREFKSKPRKRTAPAAPLQQPRPVTIAAAPSFVESATAARSSSTLKAAAPKPPTNPPRKPLAAIAPSVAASTGARAAGAGTRKVTFNPMVEQRPITPLARNTKRRSLPSTVPGSGAPLSSTSATPSWLHSHGKENTESEPITPVRKLRSYSRHWGVNSP